MYEREYYKKNRAERLAYQNKYNNDPKNKARVVMTNAARRVAAKGGEVATDPESWEKMEKIYQRAIDMSKATGIRHVVDHIIAICNGGSHAPENLQVISESENRRKWLNHDRWLKKQMTSTVNIENVNIYLDQAATQMTPEEYFEGMEDENAE